MNGDPQDPSQTPGNWQFRQTDAAPTDNAEEQSYPQEAVEQTAPPQKPSEAVTWTASEFIAHEKDAQWYAMFSISTVVVAGALYFLTHGDTVASGMIVILAIFFAIYASRKPRTLQYKLDSTGLTAGTRVYKYDNFRSFAVMDEGAVPSIVFMPLKRFSLSLTIYYALDDEEKIVTLLSNYLPLENREHDLLDQFLHRIRF